MNSTLTVFVCSTFSDLREERSQIIDAISNLQLQYGSMEIFGARSEQPIDTCIAEVRRSNILVVIVGHIYGAIVPEMNISFSEAEYQEGYRLNKTCLIYMKDDNIPILPKHMERNPSKFRLLEKWKNTLKKRHTVALFKDKKDLTFKVTNDITRAIQIIEVAEKEKNTNRKIPPAILEGNLHNIVSDAILKGVDDEVLLTSMRQTVSKAISSKELIKAPIYLSYSSKDKIIVREFEDILKNKGTILLPNYVKPEKYVLNIVHDLEKALYFVIFVSDDVKDVRVEIDLKFSLLKKLTTNRVPAIIAVLLDKHTSKYSLIPQLIKFETIHSINMIDSDVNKAVEKLVDIIKNEVYENLEKLASNNKNATFWLTSNRSI